MNRRMFIAAALAATAAPAALMAQQFEVTRTDAEWRAMLTQAEYNVMRREGTERAGSSPLDQNTAEGVYHCRGCDLALYPSRTKFDSGTGWPSFYASFENALGTKVDRKIGVARTELHCRRCGSHLGHVFNDGPPPTGQRHCINGVSLVFRAA
ncbi:peptide-methionine (R)-S-oxide reductase [Loktanella sp. DSM 29012]|uniref:peptide-methionine (R)-S-oxide reductase MsrB n=1 Tax=Loktanella sp. DSM 29012 TaxID=1881056 RepID=UPI0008AC827C|nr:peptide-methionine (R)-S-oxide reductase MsrB [Loktanella sp. DSM 29012]SEP94882.1 peptide-methionine (R)-S-oxide reductase [Loktanella sp. DSM 29012]